MRPGASFTLSCLAMLGLIFASCTPTATPAAKPTAAASGQPAAKPAASSGKPKTAAAQPKSGGELTVAIYIDMPSLDPHQESLFSTLTLAQPAMNGLIEFDPADPGWKIRPALAEKYELSKDGTTITFNLRKGVNWHDGKPFNSADAKFSLERAGANPPQGAVSPRKKAFGAIDRMETPDDSTLVLRLKYPSAEIMDLIASGYNMMMAKHVVEPLGGAKIRRLEHAIGTGPFKVKTYDTGVGWSLVRNPSYFQKGLPYLDEIRYYVIKDDATRFGAFRTKRVLLDAKSPGFSPSQKETVERSPDAGQIVVTTGFVNSLWGLWMNVRHAGPIGDARVRKAINLALDRQRMQKLFAQTQAPGIIGTMIYPGSKFAIPRETIDGMPGFRQPKDADLAEAKRLIEEARVPRDFSIPLIIREGALYRDQATVTAEELKTVGIAATVKTVDTAAFYDVQEKRDFMAMPATYGSWSPSPHFSFGDRFVTGAGRNYEQVSDPRIDSLYARQERLLDIEERKKLFWEMERIVREEIVPVATFYWATKFQGYWKEVKGYAGLGLGYYEGHRMDAVWLDR
ncbi:MAG: ABC transporter substrate-binding protein [Chloroflexi bacterium]|nr:ABC transporter substrate-binding protein [Chloroflexota bacterium]